MSAIPSLWPPDIRVEVLTPAAILRRQAAALGQQTRGRLVGELLTMRSDDRVQYSLDVVAPSLPYRARVLSAHHREDFPYPVVVESGAVGDPEYGDYPSASSEEEFFALVRTSLTAQHVRSLIESLLARINAAEGADPPPAA